MIRPMIRTRSFAEVLDDLVLPSDEAREAASQARSVVRASRSGGWFPFFAIDAETVIAPDVGGSALYYADEANDLVAPIVDIEDEDRIAVELDLDSVTTFADLARTRRAFALRNHPDLFHPRLRAMANRRMQLANMLLDRRRGKIEAGR